MSKRDDLMRAGGANVLASMGAGRGPELPAGLDPSAAARKPARLEGLARDKEAARIEVGRIVRDPDQPRTEFDPDELDRLTRSVARDGVLQPIRVRWDEGQGAYVVLMGERRWRAATAAGLRDIPCIVHEGSLDDAERLGLQLVENALRHDLRPVEQANAYRRLMVARAWSASQLAEELHLNKSTVTRALALLELPPSVQDSVEQGALPPSAAAEIAKLESPEEQSAIAAAAVEHGLTRDDVAAFVQSRKSRRPAPAARPEPVTIDLGDGMAVKLTWRKANGVSPVQMLRRALKEAQERERAGESDAA